MMNSQQHRRNSRRSYNTLLTENQTPFSKKLSRELCDPNRIYEGRPVDIGAVKAVRLA